MNMSKEEYIKMRANGNYDLKTIIFGLSLNKTVTISEYDLSKVLHFFKNNPMGYGFIETVLREVKAQLDIYFNITSLLTVEGEELKIVT